MVGHTSVNGMFMHGDVVSRKMVVDAVRVSRNHQCLLEIQQQWTTETLECALKVEGPCRSL